MDINQVLSTEIGLSDSSLREHVGNHYIVHSFLPNAVNTQKRFIANTHGSKLGRGTCRDDISNGNKHWLYLAEYWVAVLKQNTEKKKASGDAFSLFPLLRRVLPHCSLIFLL
jgi:hypothetical protein